MSNLTMSTLQGKWRSLFSAACACAVFVAVPSPTQAQQLQASAGPEAAIGSARKASSPGVSMRRVAHYIDYHFHTLGSGGGIEARPQVSSSRL